jgi:hypothetical protein
MGLFGSNGITKLGSRYPWFSIKTGTIFLFPYAINFLFESINQELLQDFKFSTVGERDLAGRKAVIVELTSPEDVLIARLWLDAQIGIVLREQYFDPVSSGKVIIESSLSDINFDNPIPTMWKRPDDSQTPPSGNLQNSFGRSSLPSSDNEQQPPLGLKFRAPPENFNLAQARISFVSNAQTDIDQKGTGTLQLYADNYFLGEIGLSDPIQMICDRSPDGSIIALADWQIFPKEASDKIYWIDLEKVELASLNIPETNILRLSFSPDNRTFGVEGYDGLTGQGRFYLVDTENNDFKQLQILAGSGSIDWSPDASQIAILDWSILPFGAEGTSNVRVYDSHNGEKINEVMTPTIPAGATTVKIPLSGWTADFQIPLQDLSQCTMAE